MIDLTNFTQEGFADWLARQPADRQFWFTSVQECLIASWIKESGICADPIVGPWDWSDFEDSAGVGRPGVPRDVFFPAWLRHISETAKDLSHLNVGSLTVSQLRNSLECNELQTKR